MDMDTKIDFYRSVGRYGVYMIWLILLRWSYCFHSETFLMRMHHLIFVEDKSEYQNQN